MAVPLKPLVFGAATGVPCRSIVSEPTVEIGDNVIARYRAGISAAANRSYRLAPVLMTNRVRTCAAGHGVGTGAARDGIVAAAASDRVRAGRPGDVEVFRLIGQVERRRRSPSA